MKKLFVLFISLVLLFSLFSCNNEVAKPNEPEQPGTEQPGTEQPGTEQPGTEQPGTEQPGTEQPGTEQPGTEQPGTDVPIIELPSDFNPTEEDLLTAPTPIDMESIQKILDNVKQISLVDAQPILVEVVTAALEQGITLNLPNSKDGNIISLTTTGAFTQDNKLTVTAIANIPEYSLGENVTANGQAEGTITFDFNALNGQSVNSGSESSSFISYDLGKDTNLSIKIGDDTFIITNLNDVNNLMAEIGSESPVSNALKDAYFNSMGNIVDQLFTVVQEFFARGYELKTDHISVIIQGSLNWEFKDGDFTAESFKSGSFGDVFNSITMSKLTVAVSTNKEITLDDSGYQMALVVNVKEAKAVPGSETVYGPKGPQLIDGCKLSIDVDATLKLETRGAIGDNTIYGIGHFEGFRGLNGYIEGQENSPKYSAYIRFNDTDYNAVELVKNIVESMNSPVQGE